MPEFILDRGAPAASRRYAALDDFTRGYIEAMFFTETGTGDDGEMEHVTLDDLAPETWAKLEADCRAFQEANADDLAEACDTVAAEGYDMEAAGRDYWYSRNGHGVGYWDRQLGAIGDKLHAVAKHHAVDLYLGDDGRLYLA